MKPTNQNLKHPVLKIKYNPKRIWKQIVCEQTITTFSVHGIIRKQQTNKVEMQAYN